VKTLTRNEFIHEAIDLRMPHYLAVMDHDLQLRFDLVTLWRAMTRLLTPEQCASLTGFEEEACGRAEKEAADHEARLAEAERRRHS